MWSFFSRDPSKDFAFEIGCKVDGLEDKSIWTIHDGKRKSNGETVTVFCFDIKNSSESQVQLAKASFKKIKTLRHPNILTFVDGLENDKVIYIVTEAVTPLDAYIRRNTDQQISNELAISWGLHQISKGLGFLINDCNFIHNNVCMSSIFVDKAGEWKLGGVDYMYPTTGQESLPPVKILPALERYDPPERAGPGRKPTEPWSTDSWGLGCLIWEIFNGTLQRTNALKTLGKIPKSLVSHYCELVGANPKSRPNPTKFIQSCRSQGFMDNKFVDTMLFLEEIQMKDQTEKSSFFNSLPTMLDTFPQSFCRYTILPRLLHAFEYGNAGSAVLAPLFKLGKCLDKEEYQEKIVPCIVKLFSSTDRSTRVKLLQQIETFVEHLNPSIVNDKIFPNLLHGFNDTNPVVREQTIKGMMHLAPKLNYKNLNEELLKHFARLQSKDDQGGIRTNTTICLGKIAAYLNPEMRQKVLASAYLRAMKDPFPPARQAAVIAMAATNNFFTLNESATRLLPSLCVMVMDPEKVVRDQAFKAIKCFLSKLEKVSENPEITEELEKDVKSGGIGTTAAAAGWTGWAVGGVSSLTSKFYKGKGHAPAQVSSTATNPVVKHTTQAKSSDTPPISVEDENQSTTKDYHNLTQSSSAQFDIKEPPDNIEDEDDDHSDYGDAEADQWGDTEGWDDDANWGNMDDYDELEQTTVVGDGWHNPNDNWDSMGEQLQPKSSQKTTEKSSTSTTTGALQLGLSKKERSPSPWGGSNAEFSAVNDSDLVSTSNYNWGQESQQNQQDFFSSLLEDEKRGSKSVKSSSHRIGGQKKQTGTSSVLSKNTAKPASTIKSSNSIQSSKISSSAQSQKTSILNSWGDDGWGTSIVTDTSSDWNIDDWQSPDSTGKSNAELLKKQREEKRMQRQKEMDEKRAARKTGTGIMKLGTKKLSKD